jgi:hypothetical protein
MNGTKTYVIQLYLLIRTHTHILIAAKSFIEKITSVFSRETDGQRILYEGEQEIQKNKKHSIGHGGGGIIQQGYKLHA